MSKKIKDLTNKKFNKLLVKSLAGSNRNGNKTWLCLCDCGKEKVFSSDHLTRKINPVKSCGCSRHRKGKLHHQYTGYCEITGNWWYNHIYRETKQKSRQKLKINITKKYAWNLFLKQNRKCSLSGIDLTIGTHLDCNASIDRIDSSKGYEIGNIQWVDKHINFMKRIYSQEFFIKMCKKVAKNFS